MIIQYLLPDGLLHLFRLRLKLLSYLSWFVTLQILTHFMPFHPPDPHHVLHVGLLIVYEEHDVSELPFSQMIGVSKILDCTKSGSFT